MALYRPGTGRLNGVAMSNLVFLLNGPNLNRLGLREPEIYGHQSLDSIVADLHERAAALGLVLDCRQSNHEGHLLDWLHEAADLRVLAVILNPGAYTHTSIALRDAISGMDVPVIEVHLSNPAARERFRHLSHVSPVARGVIQGFGAHGYALALDAAAALRQEPGNNRKDGNG